MKLSSIILVLCATTSIGCDPFHPALTAAEEKMGDQLAGEWTMRLTVVHSPVLDFGDHPVPSEVVGRISLLRNNSLDRRFTSIRIPIAYGIYDVDLTRFGLEPRERGKTPTVIAGRLKNDSIELILSPERDAGSLSLEGRIENGRITGSWWMTLRSSGGAGTFVLERADRRAFK